MVERYCGCRASSLFFRSKPKYSTFRRRRSLIYNSFCRNGRSEDYAAGLVYMAGLVRGLPAVPGLKKVTADASGFVALTQEGMAGTSQDLPAAEAAAAGVLPCASAFVVRPDI